MFLSDSSLDREVKDSYTVTANAEDIGHFSNTAQLTIIVTDCNDETPLFEMKSNKTELQEGTKKLSQPFFLQVCFVSTVTYTQV